MSLKRLVPVGFALLMFCASVSAQVSQSMAYRISALHGGGAVPPSCGGFTFLFNQGNYDNNNETMTIGPVNTSGANLLYIIYRNAQGGAGTLTDDAGNTYHKLKTLIYQSPSGANLFITNIAYYCINPTTNSGTTFSFNGNQTAAIVFGFSCSGTISLDTETTNWVYNGAGNPTTVQLPQIIPNGSELFITGVGWEYDDTAAIDSSFVYAPYITAGGFVAASYKVSSGSESPAWSVDGPGNYITADMVTFRSTGCSGGGGSPIIAGSTLYWKLDDNTGGAGATVADASGNSLTGTIAGAPTWSAPYIGISSLKFNGGSDDVSSSVSSLLDATTTDQSLTWWIKPTVTPSSTVVVGGIAASGINHYNLLELISGGFAKVQAQPSGGSPISVTGSANLNDGNWHFIAITLDHVANTVTLWVDNVNIGTSSAGIGNWTYSGAYSIGQYRVSGGSAYTGYIDEAAVYPFILNSTQLSSLYAQTHP